jgi:flagellar biosynthetic protein FlhB
MADATTRTERATPKRREEARRHGQIVVSPEISPVAVLCVVLATAAWGGPMLLERTSAVLVEWLAAAGRTAAHDDPIGPLAWRTVAMLGSVLGPFFLTIAVVGIGAVVAQVGWHPNPELIAPDPSRIGFTAGAKRIFSLQGMASLVKAVVKIALVATVGWRVVVDVGGQALRGIDDVGRKHPRARRRRAARARARHGGGARGGGCGRLRVARWRHEQSLKMSRYELREELKQSEGDPQVRMRFRRAHREIAKRRMLGEVARADVVLTNPVHVAVALRYRPEESAAPRVVAKGADALAARIKDAARAAGVPIVERRALARALYRAVQVGGEIPPHLYRAVAEILAYIYSLRGNNPVEAR